MKRLDQWLLELNLVPSRTRAKELIETGAIAVRRNNGDWVKTLSSAEKFENLSREDVQVTDADLLRFVARSGLKLQRALETAGIDVRDFLCIDIGQSTGGFTDCLLQNGAKRVVGIDVGRDQLAPSLVQHPSVEFYEGVNAKEIGLHPAFKNAQAQFDLLVMDVSFISVEKVLPPALPFLKENAKLLVLIKPQFELGAGALNKRGIVQDATLFVELERKIVQLFSDLGLKPIQYFDSQLPGRDGNQEFFIYASNCR